MVSKKRERLKLMRGPTSEMLPFFPLRLQLTSMMKSNLLQKLWKTPFEKGGNEKDAGLGFIFFSVADQ